MICSTSCRSQIIAISSWKTKQLPGSIHLRNLNLVAEFILDWINSAQVCKYFTSRCDHLSPLFVPQVEKDVGNKHILAKESSFSSEQSSRLVSESVMSSSVVSKKVSSTSIVSSSSISSSSESQVKSITLGWSPSPPRCSANATAHRLSLYIHTHTYTHTHCNHIRSWPRGQILMSNLVTKHLYKWLLVLNRC